MPNKGSDLATTVRFFLNPRAGFGAKLLLVLAVLYVIMPLDFVPDVAVIVGWIDDLVAMLGATTALLLALRRYQRDNRRETNELSPEAPGYAAPRVVETQGTEVR